MDPRLDHSSLGKPWSGIAVAHGDHAIRLGAHAQEVLWWGSALPDQKMAIYDARVSSGGAHFVLELAEYTKVVYIPDDEEGDMFKFKEVTAGVGGIGMAAKHLGFQCLALMDINQMVCETLAANGHYNVIQGDVLIPQDRFRLHECHNARRGWLFSGFPCQPLSTQGDQKGEHDERAKVFFAVIKTAWEQQVKGLLLECSGSTHCPIRAGYVATTWLEPWFGDLPNHFDFEQFLAEQKDAMVGIACSQDLLSRSHQQPSHGHLFSAFAGHLCSVADLV